MRNRKIHWLLPTHFTETPAVPGPWPAACWQRLALANLKADLPCRSSWRVAWHDVALRKPKPSISLARCTGTGSRRDTKTKTTWKNMSSTTAWRTPWLILVVFTKRKRWPKDMLILVQQDGLSDRPVKWISLAMASWPVLIESSMNEAIYSQMSQTNICLANWNYSKRFRNWMIHWILSHHVSICDYDLAKITDPLSTLLNPSQTKKRYNPIPLIFNKPKYVVSSPIKPWFLGCV